MTIRLARRRLVPAALALLLLAPAAARGQANTVICHATGDPNTPYQQIEVSPDASLEHLQHDQDIVPAPPEGCPAQIVPDEPDPAPAYPVPTATPPDAVPAPQRPRPRRPRRPRRRQGAPQAPVAPSIQSGNLGATADVPDDELPMTGGEVPAVALMGLSFLLAGAGLRLRYAR